jgi:hypothetical protein
MIDGPLPRTLRPLVVWNPNYRKGRQAGIYIKQVSGSFT